MLFLPPARDDAPPDDEGRARARQARECLADNHDMWISEAHLVLLAAPSRQRGGHGADRRRSRRL